MRRTIWAGLVITGGAALQACAPAPPYEQAVQERPSTSLPQAEAVTTQALDGPSATGIDTEGPGDGASGAGGDATSGEVAGSDTVTQPGPGGLTERLPDTCQLESYRDYVGEEGVSAASQVIDRPVRVIAPDAIVSQVYNPQRVNFYTDGSGRVTRISCG